MVDTSIFQFRHPWIPEVADISRFVHIDSRHDDGPNGSECYFLMQIRHVVISGEETIPDKNKIAIILYYYFAGGNFKKSLRFDRLC
jgi:hypothetical protein